jgi:uncharacterized iron-regulated protein
MLIIISLLFLPVVSNSEQLPTYNLEVSFDIHNSKIIGVAKIDVSAGKDIALHIGQLKINDLSLNQQKIQQPDVQNGILKVLPHQTGTLIVRYEGVFKDKSNAFDTKYGVVKSVIDDRGISLTGIWYPQPDDLLVYRLTALLPEGYEAVSEAEKIEKKAKDGQTEFIFEFPYPVDGINLIATNRYEIIKESFNDIEVYAYFFREDIQLAKKYIEYTMKYLNLYESLLGKFPYKRFSIVENFLPTGYSMPTYTLLGQDIVRLPFIVETSLGHEILHQWFGNLVYIDYENGNWAEGLTTYLADHLYEEQKGNGWQYRKQILIDYMSYVNEKNDFALKDFRGRTDFASKSIGYGKAAMVFHMLKKMMGQDAFYKALNDIVTKKKFQRVSWEDIKEAFTYNYFFFKSLKNFSEKSKTQKTSWKDLQDEFKSNLKDNLDWFFKQLIDEKGIPEINLTDARVKQNGSKFEVSFNIIQRSQNYIIDVPVSFYYLNGDKKTDSFRIDKERNSFNILLDYEPAMIVMDEDYDTVRRLSQEEFPPVIARLLGDERIIIVPTADKETYKDIIDNFKEKNAVEKEESDIKDSEIKNSSLIIIGNNNKMIGRLYGAIEYIDAGFSFVIKENPWNRQKVVAIVNAKSKDEADAAFRKIFHYGKYSAVAFDGGRNIYKNIEKSQKGIKRMLMERAAAIDVSAVKTLDDVIKAVSNKKIIYVGEFHDRFSHHNVQLQVIRGLYEKNKKIAVGMEMFQRPFQNVLDDYIAEKIDEKEFLNKSEYFKRWGFDYNLYKPIVDFARQEKLPVIALNIEREIIDKVSKGGLDSLSKEEKEKIPSQMDFSDNDYKERLKRVFKMHDRSDEKNFDFFYQSQLLWDETMATSIDEFLKKNEDYQVIVLAGGGHIAYGSGIPKRAFRRNGYDYAIIMIDVDIDKNIADYVVFPKPLDGVTAPKLMVFLREYNGKIKIEMFPENSVSKKAGLKEGDIILSLDDVPIRNINDLRLYLFYKKSGDTVKAKILRKRFLLDDKEIEVEIKL